MARIGARLLLLPVRQPIAVRVAPAVARVQGVEAVARLKAVQQPIAIRVGMVRIGAPGGFVRVVQAIAIGIDEDVRHRAKPRPGAIGLEAYPPTVDLGRRAHVYTKIPAAPLWLTTSSAAPSRPMVAVAPTAEEIPWKPFWVMSPPLMVAVVSFRTLMPWPRFWRTVLSCMMSVLPTGSSETLIIPSKAIIFDDIPRQDDGVLTVLYEDPDRIRCCCWCCPSAWRSTPLLM